jgi:UDP-glucose:(heptosyl)LPS alpha-1,3-glucosyltransferase
VKLAIICRPFSFHGGVETATAGLMGELVRRGYAIDLISTRRQPDVAGARVRRLPVVAGPSIVRFVSFALAARAVVRGSRYDVVQSHERSLAQDIYRAGEGVHRAYLEAMGRPRVQPFHRLVCAVERRAFTLASARHIAAISRRDKAEIERRFGTPPDCVSVIYNGVDLERFHPDNRERYRGPVRAELGLAASDRAVLFVGSGFARKGLGALVDALALSQGPRWRLVVAGKGDTAPYRARAAALGVDDRITWLGPRRDVERLYAAADVAALPARY